MNKITAFAMGAGSRAFWRYRFATSFTRSVLKSESIRSEQVSGPSGASSLVSSAATVRITFWRAPAS
ncbi:MAG: hypothetical protein ACLSFT_04715 [Ruminococcus callidus]